MEILAWMTDHVDATPLLMFRSTFGFLMVVHIARLHFHGMYERSILSPSFHFDFGRPLPFTPSKPWHGHTHLVLMTIAATALTLGWRTRMSAAAFATLYAGFVLSDRTMFNNHYYLYVLIAGLLCLIQPAATHACRWRLTLLRVQVCVVYFYAGVAKLNSDWLLHAEPMRSKLSSEAAMYHPYLAGLLTRSEAAIFVSLARY